MTRRSLLFIIIGWVILKLVEYYLLPYFVVSLLWIIASATLLIITTVQLLKLIKDRKRLTRNRWLSFASFLILFYLTINSWIVHEMIEKIDWHLFYQKRMEIVKQVKSGHLNPNVSWNSWVCELPYEFPIVSNGGNDIGISRNKETNSVTVTFWVYRNFFDAPSTTFVFTDDKDEIAAFDERVAVKPENNWKLRDGWYRLFGE